MFLVLHRPQQNRVGQIHHLRHAPPRRSKQHALRFRRTIDNVVGRTEILANQLRLMLVERALQVARQKAIHDVHARRQAQLRHATQNQRLVGGLLRVLAEQHDPARIQRTINIVVAAMHVQRMLGQRACAHFQHHRRTLARRVIVLLHAVDNALPEVKFTTRLPQTE